MSKNTALARLEDMLTPILSDMGYGLVRLHYSGGFGRNHQSESEVDDEGGDEAANTLTSQKKLPTQKLPTKPKNKAKKDRRPATLQIMAERLDAANMTVRDCTKISRVVSDVLEQDDPLKASYLLEVSSPGLDRPLVKAQDYERFSGETARIEMALLLDGRKKFTGTLAGLSTDEAGTFVQLKEEAVLFRLPLALIEKARLVITDEVMARELARQENLIVLGESGALDESQFSPDRIPQNITDKIEA